MSEIVSVFIGICMLFCVVLIVNAWGRQLYHYLKEKLK